MTSPQRKLFDELTVAKFRKPFVPFVIVLLDGRRFEVTDRWHVAFGDANQRIVVLPNGGVSRFFSWGDVRAIEALETAN